MAVMQQSTGQAQMSERPLRLADLAFMRSTPPTLSVLPKPVSDASAGASSAVEAGVDSVRVRQLTAGMCLGEEAAFNEFYENYCDRLHRYLLVLTRGNEDLSRELMQASMTKAVLRPREFDQETRLWHWLATIARHSFIDALRRSQRAPEFVAFPLVEVPASDDEANVDAQAPLFAALDRSLLELDTEEQALIDFFYFKRGSMASVAAQQQTTPKAVESKLARLRQKLRAAILRRLRYENE
jgi:RNA polymerase sigma-70 factor (ECF subfamily)